MIQLCIDGIDLESNFAKTLGFVSMKEWLGDSGDAGKKKKKKKNKVLSYIFSLLFFNLFL